MTDLKRRYQEECMMDHLMAVLEIEEHFQPVLFDDLFQAATEILAAEAQGPQLTFELLVVLSETTPIFPTEVARWRYRAVLAAQAHGQQGCLHTVEAASVPWAQAVAVRAHEQQCLGK